MSSRVFGRAPVPGDRGEWGSIVQAAGVEGLARRVRVACMIGILAAGLVSTSAFSQGASPPPADRLAAAELAAEQADAAAVEARSLADRLAAEEAETERDAARAVAESRVRSSSGSSELDEAVRRAEAAAESAAAAARVVADAERRARRAPQRSGPFVGGAFLYGAENFDDGIIVKSSLGGAGFVGYRISPVFAVEVRYEGFDGFDLEASNGRGTIDGFAVTASAKVYPFAGRLQPFAAVGFGGVRFEQKNVLNDGSRSRFDDSDVAFRFAGGVDAWLSDEIVLNLEAAYLGPVDELSNLEVTVLSMGLTYRF